jgi:hypothetical protein
LILIVIYFDILYVLVLDIYIGISRPNLDPAGDYLEADCIDGWFMAAEDGTLWGSGKEYGDYAGGSVTGPVVAAVQMYFPNESVRLLPNAPQPE